MSLCGISSRFQLLSRSIGQIIHVLLTRPPLKCTRIDPKVSPAYISARLACVGHAASVHPEPGSNSQVYFFIRRSFETGPLVIRFAHLSLTFLLSKNLKSECLIAVSPGLQLRCSPFVWQNLFWVARLTTRFPFGPLVSQLTIPIQKNLRFALWLRCVVPCSRVFSCLHEFSHIHDSTLTQNSTPSIKPFLGPFLFVVILFSRGR